jgi:hypothetical protein
MLRGVARSTTKLDNRRRRTRRTSRRHLLAQHLRDRGTRSVAVAPSAAMPASEPDLGISSGIGWPSIAASFDAADAPTSTPGRSPSCDCRADGRIGMAVEPSSAPSNDPREIFEIRR